MPGTSPGMTITESVPLHAASLDLHGHARFRGADAARTRRSWPRDRGRVHPRAEAGWTPWPAVAADARRAGGAAARHSRADAVYTQDAAGAGGISRAQRGRRRGRRL